MRNTAGNEELEYFYARIHKFPRIQKKAVATIQANYTISTNSTNNTYADRKSVATITRIFMNSRNKPVAYELHEFTNFKTMLGP